MPLITLRSLSIRYIGAPLLDSVDCQIEPNQKIGLLGRNGTGKTTLLGMLAGEVQPDSGELTISSGVKVAWLPQDVPQNLNGTVTEIVASGLPHRDEHDEGHWKDLNAIDQIIARLTLDPEAQFSSLSSGWKRRVLLARALVSQPDLLLLDEPTNHLDIDAISWLEQFFERWNGTLLFVTHDRMFLRKLATRILEIDRGRMFDWSCDYDTFLKRKEAALAAEEKQNALFDKRLAEEEVWIRQGIKARRTRNEGRVRALEEMRRVRSDRRNKEGKAKIEIQSAQRSGMLVAEVNKVSFQYGSRIIVRDFSTQIMRGDKVGIVGPNGIGKTTLLRILLGQLEPQNGNVRLGTNLQIAYFDQLRQQLIDDKSVQDNVSDGATTITIGEQKRHVIGYLQDFLFSPERARTPVRFLSGGERNRVLLAKLFAKPANVIVLDEPTNDLDTETLELLEERLSDFPGTVMVVSHDRSFLNNVVTSTIAMTDDGAREFIGGYDDWVRQRNDSPYTNEERDSRNEKVDSGKSPATAPKPAKKKLSFKEQQELAALPATIEQLEGKLAKIHEEMADGGFYQQAKEKILAKQNELEDTEAKLARAFERWELLDG